MSNNKSNGTEATLEECITTDQTFHWVKSDLCFYASLPGAEGLADSVSCGNFDRNGMTRYASATLVNSALSIAKSKGLVAVEYSSREFDGGTEETYKFVCIHGLGGSS